MILSEMLTQFSQSEVADLVASGEGLGESNPTRLALHFTYKTLLS